MTARSADGSRPARFPVERFEIVWNGSERPEAEPQTLLTEVPYLRPRLIIDAVVQRNSKAFCNF